VIHALVPFLCVVIEDTDVVGPHVLAAERSDARAVTVLATADESDLLIEAGVLIVADGICAAGDTLALLASLNVNVEGYRSQIRAIGGTDDLRTDQIAWTFVRSAAARSRAHARRIRRGDARWAVRFFTCWIFDATPCAHEVGSRAAIASAHGPAVVILTANIKASGFVPRSPSRLACIYRIKAFGILAPPTVRAIKRAVAGGLLRGFGAADLHGSIATHHGAVESGRTGVDPRSEADETIVALLIGGAIVCRVAARCGQLDRSIELAEGWFEPSALRMVCTSGNG